MTRPAGDDRCRVAVLDDYQGVAARFADWASAADRLDVRFLRTHEPSEDVLADVLRDVDVLVLMRERTPLPASLIRRLPGLRLVVTTGARNAAIDVAAAHEAGVVVSGTRGLSTPAAELTWALVLALARQVPAEDAAVRGGRWQESVGTGLEGATLGLLGLGTVGAHVARVGQAFGMRVVAWSQNLTAERAEQVGAVKVAPSDLFGEADVVSIHLRLSARTAGLVGASELRAMRPTSYLVNTSRAQIVDQEALVHALAEGWIAGAGLDVFAQEPLPVDHSYRSLPRTVLTPHIGYVVRQNYRIFFEDALQAIHAFLDGAPVRTVQP